MVIENKEWNAEWNKINKETTKKRKKKAMNERDERNEVRWYTEIDTNKRRERKKFEQCNKKFKSLFKIVL